MNEVLKVDYSSISALRNDYLNSLAVFQDVFLELKALSSEYFGIESEEKVIGYAICSADQVLIEFYLKPDFIRQCSFYFNLIISRLGVKRIYCQSFDTLLLNCCIQNNFPYHTEGWLFRDFYQTENYFSNAIQMRFAEEPDYHFLHLQPDGLYESSEELEILVRGRNILMFFSRDNLVGCGFLIRVHPDFNFFDIGMWVHPDSRKQGFATQIIAYLKNLCLENDWIPICGCAAGNEASQRTLARNGFYSRYKLIEFCV